MGCPYDRVARTTQDVLVVLIRHDQDDIGTLFFHRVIEVIYDLTGTEFGDSLSRVWVT